MKTAFALIIGLGIAVAVAARLTQTPSPPERPAGSWEPAGPAHR